MFEVANIAKDGQRLAKDAEVVDDDVDVHSTGAVLLRLCGNTDP